ncbi:hypothetical protein PIB30_095354, partial [Stylosanthes scabra]|nr:hypothetical protein [Stylosanthes scabra]
VELGFKEARPWPGNAKFQFWPSFKITLQHKVAYAIYGSYVRNSVQRALWKLAEEEVAYAYTTKSGQLALHESLFPMLSLAFYKYFPIPKVLKYASKHIKAPSGMELYKFYSIKASLAYIYQLEQI